MPFVSNDPRTAANGNYSTSQQIAALYGYPMGYMGAVRLTAAQRKAAQEKKRADQQAAAAAHKAAVAAQHAARTTDPTAKRAAQKAATEAHKAAQVQKRATQQAAVVARKAAQAAGKPAKLTAEGRKQAQKDKLAAKLGIQCQPGETPKKCHGTAMCLKAGEKCGGGKGAPKKVTPQQDEAMKKQMLSQIAQGLAALCKKNPQRAAAFYQKHAAQLQQAGITAPCSGVVSAAATAAPVKRQVVRKRLRGFFGLGGFSAMGSMGQVCADGVSVPDVNGLCPDGSTATSTATGAALPAQLTQMVNTPPPKGCDRNPNKPVCMFYQMSTQMQTFMMAFLQILQELVAELGAGGTTGGALQQCEAGYIMDINGNCVASGTDGAGCPPGMVLDAYGQCITGGVQQQCPSGVDPNTGQCYPYGQAISPYAQAPYPADMYSQQQQPYMPGYGGQPAVESLPGTEATGMETMIPQDINVGYAAPGYGYQPSVTPEAIPAGFDVGEADVFGGGAGGEAATQIPVEMPVSQTVGMPMFVQPAAQQYGTPTTDQYSAAELVEGPYGAEQFLPQAEEYQPQMVAMPQVQQQQLQAQMPIYPYPTQQFAQSVIPEAPQGYLPQQYAEMPAPSIEPLPYGQPRAYQAPVATMQPQLPAGVLPQQPLELVAPEAMSPELIPMPAGDIYGATVPVQGQAEILASMVPGQEPLEVTD